MNEELTDEQGIFNEEITRIIEEFKAEEGKENETEESSPSNPPLTPSVQEEVRKDESDSSSKVILSRPKPILKELPSNLKYAFIDENEYYPVIVNSSLNEDQTSRLLIVLSENRKAIGWHYSDLKGISSTYCLYKILLEDGANPFKEGQRRLNPHLHEVVREEIIKLFDAKIIFPISDSKWVSALHVVPKKSGIMVEPNEKGELISKR